MSLSLCDKFIFIPCGIHGYGKSLYAKEQDWIEMLRLGIKEYFGINPLIINSFISQKEIIINKQNIFIDFIELHQSPYLMDASDIIW